MVVPARERENIPGFILATSVKGTFPTMFQAAFFAERGGLASYGATDGDLGRQAARLVDRILKGVKPADLPVEQPTKFEVVINISPAAPRSVLLHCGTRGQLRRRAAAVRH